MGRYLLPIDHRRPHEFFVNDAAILVLRNIAFGELEPVDKHRLEWFSEDLLIELNHPSGVLDDLRRFDTGKLVEEPAAACIHQHRMSLHLHEL